MGKLEGAIRRWEQSQSEGSRSPVRGESNAGKGRSFIFTKRRRARRTTEVVLTKKNGYMVRVREGAEVSKTPIEDQEYYEKLEEQAGEANRVRIEAHRVGS